MYPNQTLYGGFIMNYLIWGPHHALPIFRSIHNVFYPIFHIHEITDAHDVTGFILPGPRLPQHRRYDGDPVETLSPRRRRGLFRSD